MSPRTAFPLVIALVLAASCRTAGEPAPSAAEHLARGEALYEAGRYEEALAAYRSSDALAPADPFVLDLMGEALYELERHEEALAVLDRAVALGPENAYAHSHRGQVLHALGRYDEAVRSFDRALDLSPGVEHFARARERAREAARM